jgi:EAL domain-containing protein (putative c-di-GMP-specific phosphodiesterase class I)
MSEGEEVAERLVRLGQMGVQLTLDDFGTGYSSLSHLKRLRIHRIKIDRSFVQDLPDSADSRAISTAIIGLAHGLGLEVVAEGVETPEQLAFLREKGCRAFQGNLFSPPLPPEQVAAFLVRNPG